MLQFICGRMDGKEGSIPDEIQKTFQISSIDNSIPLSNSLQHLLISGG